MTDQEKYRHDFLLKYYDMAVKDLDRHLKFGVDTVVVLGAVATALTAIGRDWIPTPIGVSFAFLSIAWGAMSLISSNYWSLRAIAFLANVEAVYFTEEDRSIFNPYIGSHPPYRFISSLRSHLLLFSMLYVLVFLTGGFKFNKTHTVCESAWTFLVAGNFDKSWWVAALLAIIIPPFLAREQYKKVKEYRTFVESCLGPGLIKKNPNVRSVNLKFSDENEADVLPPETVQRFTIDDALAKMRNTALIGVFLFLGAAIAVILVVTG